MSFSLTWLPEVLRAAGLKVALVDGWESRGNGDVGPTRGVICHHTAGSRVGNMPSLEILIEGRPDLPGPLSQLGLGRDGTFYVIAAGKCHHAGVGRFRDVTTGNTSFIGIEAEHTGKPLDPWPEIQVDAYQRGVAAILARAGLKEDTCIGHKEWAPGRKPDPTFSMAPFRARVAELLAGGVPPRPQIPSSEPDKPAGAARPTLRRGSSGSRVAELQTRLGLPATGQFDARTEARVREFQRANNLVSDGIFGPKSWSALDSTNRGTQSMAGATWPNTLASKVLAAYIHSKFGLLPAELMLRNPPMGAMPFFNNSASPPIRLAELGLVAGDMLRFFAELSIPFENGKSLNEAHDALVAAMQDENAASAGMSVAVDAHYRFLDE